MRIKSLIAFYIWQAREEVGLSGNEEHDWALAEEFLEYCGDDTFDYESVYSWLMENETREEM